MTKKLSKPIYVTQAALPPFEDFVKEIKPIWDAHWLTNQGPLHEKFKGLLKDFLGAKGLTLCVNGHMALDIALKSLKAKGEIITTPFTFVSTTHAIAMNGFKPVFCDIKPDDFTIDEERIESLITPQTVAILPVHVYGTPCAVERLEEMAKRRKLKLIYDAAHAFGVECAGRPLACYGDIAMLSFHATKAFNTIEGGALVYDDPSLELEFDNLKNFGIRGPEDVVAVGLNAKMNEFQAAMGVCNLKGFSEEVAKRERLSSIYRDSLSKVPGVKLLPERKGVKGNYAYFPILVDEKAYGRSRDELFAALCELNVFPRKYFYPLVPDCACYKDAFAGLNLPVARYVSERIMTLPLYGGLGDGEQARVCEAVRGFRKRCIGGR